METKEVMRFYEIAFYKLMTYLNKYVPNENLDLFIQTLCRTFKIDYTNISLLKSSQHLARLKPSKEEDVYFCTEMNIPMKYQTVDYRTVLKYRKQWKGFGETPAMYQRTLNKYFRDDMVKFLKAYVIFTPESLQFIRIVVENTIEEVEQDG